MSVVTYSLEMLNVNALNEKPKPQDLTVVEAEVKEFRFNRYLYQLVGESWGWTDKLEHSDEQWQEYANSESLRPWVGYYQGSIAGYFELKTQTAGNVELAYFGLAPQFIGKGLGGYLLSKAIKSAWSMEGVKRVWVHTCSLDHPSALANYQARGFEIYAKTTD